MAQISNRSLIKYHRQLGLFAAVLAAILAITGLLLQHTDRLGLDSHYLRANWLLSWYSYPQPESHQIQLKQHLVVHVDNQLVVDGRWLGTTNGALWGAADNSDTLLVGAGSRLYWLDQQAQLLDTLEAPVDEPLALGSLNKDFLLQAAEGWLKVDQDLEQWDLSIPFPGKLTSPQAISLNQVQLPAKVPVGVSLERLLLDLHSGRLFGTIGVLLMDLAALALTLLAVTGCWVWLRKR